MFNYKERIAKLFSDKKNYTAIISITLIVTVFYAGFVFMMLKNRPESAYSYLSKIDEKNKKDTQGTIKLQDTRLHDSERIN